MTCSGIHISQECLSILAAINAVATGSYTRYL